MSVCVKFSGIRVVETNTIKPGDRPITGGLLDMGVPLMHPIVTGKGIIVGVVDTGVDFNHEWLKGSILATKDFTGTRPDGFDDNSHGTHVCGIVKQVAPDVRLVVAKVLQADGYGNESWVAAGVRWLADWVGANGEKITAINQSLGGSTDDPEIRAAMEYADAKGIVLPCAAGNNGDENPNTDDMGYPGKYKQALAVAACGSSSDPFNFRPAPFTSSGPANPEDGVDICSYGVEVLSTLPGNQWGYLSGTSMATPHITGAVALNAELYGVKRQGCKPSGDALYDMIVCGGVPLRTWDPVAQKLVYPKAWNNIVGAGRFTFSPGFEYVTIETYLGCPTMYVSNGSETKEFTLDAPPMPVTVPGGQRTMIPARPYAENGFNGTVTWAENALPPGQQPGKGKVTVQGYRAITPVVKGG